MNRYHASLGSLTILFLFLQFAVQVLIGVNPYVIIHFYDIPTHFLGGYLLESAFLFLLLPASLIFVFAFCISWEIIELTITKYHLMSPDKMFATTLNSVQDVIVGMLGALLAITIYNYIHRIKPFNIENYCRP